MRFLDKVRVLLCFVPLPVLKRPNRKVSLREKLIYTVISLLIFSACNHLPLYGIQNLPSMPIRLPRILPSNHRPGTVMELGIRPLVTSVTFLHFLAQPKLFAIDNHLPQDRALLNAAHKFLAILVACLDTSVYLARIKESGDQLPALNQTLLIFQLCFPTFIFMFLDELLRNGYGFGSGLFLFMAFTVCQDMFWKTFSPVKINNTAEYEGALVALFHQLITRTDKLSALRDTFFRQNLPNMTNLLATLLIILVVIYLHGIAIVFPVNSRGPRQSYYPIKFFYHSDFSILVQSIMLGNLNYVSHDLFLLLNKNESFLVRLLGKWKETVPVSGLSYYVTAPSSLADMVANPYHALFYIWLMFFVYTMILQTWVEISEFADCDAARQLLEQQINKPRIALIPSQAVVYRFVSKAAAAGGMCVGMLTILGDLTGAFGSGPGIVLAIIIIYQHLETFENDRAEILYDQQIQVSFEDLV
ncbi:hypothetical protein ACFE04_004716 [Oxalis oulophora]